MKFESVRAIAMLRQLLAVEHMPVRIRSRLCAA